MSLASKARAFVWGEVPGSKLERNLLFKVSTLHLFAYFTNYLDRSNINNAFVSGMKEDLKMFGKEINKINTFFTCGYIVGMIPNNLMLQVIRPRIWFPVCQILCTSAVTSVEQIYAIRFLQGIVESSTFVGCHYILGAWYKPAEAGETIWYLYQFWINRHTVRSHSRISLSTFEYSFRFSGVLQAAVYKHLNGHAGRSGWRWLFIIDGVITLPVAFYGFLVFPDKPVSTKAFYLSEAERSLAYERMKNVVQSDPPSLSLDTARRVLSKWRFYGCSLLFAISGETEILGSAGIMGQWMKAIGGYHVEQIDYYPTGLTAVAIASTLICATWTDYTKKRWPVLVYMAISCIIAAIILLAPKSPRGLQFFAFCASYAGQATTFAWANQICADDDQERGIVLASMNLFNNVINAWWPLVLYPATDAPRFFKGMIALICMSIATLMITWEWGRASRSNEALEKASNEDDEGRSTESNKQE
ncbi:MFS general substrate transporter [Flagelloscypha sp. PMI_526]|nr:MFS general substrate transporter [Flagelloscypha sp. PMI_526]